MELTVYRQASKIRPDGTIVYKGEDALPYVDGQMLLVADGLGGAAAIRHQKIKQELFDSDKLLDTLFEGVYEDYHKEEFVEYVLNSFFELFAVKDCYTKNINNIKKSGYFASRIVTAVVLHEMLYNDKVGAEKLFETYAKAKENGKANEFLDSLGDHFKRLIQTNIRKIAENANLVYESSYSGLSLLGSTLCATIYLEHDDFVEAIYLTAGDSRPYIWSEKQGLQQVLQDQEGKDGGMTNYIRANDDADFEIRCNYFKFKKPCVIFNASDGCFDSGKFISQIAFEKLILETACASDTAEQMGERLTAFFLDYGRHDDSSTIAMKMYGYETYEDYKKSSAKRMTALNDEYFTAMPELLDADYIAEYEQCENAFPAKMVALKTMMEAEEGVTKYCTRAVKKEYSPYFNAITEIERHIADEKKKISFSEMNIESIIAQNFIKFKPYLDQKDGLVDKITLSKILKVDSKYQEKSTDYIAKLKHYKSDFDRIVQSLNSLLENIYEIGVPSGFDDFDEINYLIVENCERSMNELFDFFHELKSKKLDIVKKLTQQREEYIQKNIRLAEKQSESLKMLRSMIFDGRIIVSELDILSDDKTNLINEMEIIKNANSEIKRLKSEEKTEALNKAVKEYWNNNYATIIAEIVKNPCDGISDAVLLDAKSLVAELNEQTKDIKEKSEMQRILFEKYDVGYNAYLGGCAE